MLLLLATALADSPLTSIDFAPAYADVPAVLAARDTRRAEGAVLDFLLSDAPIDQRIAVVNALGWSFEGQANAARYATGLARKKNLPARKLTPVMLAPEERFLLGYLVAMDDYFELRNAPGLPPAFAGLDALALVDEAAARQPQVFSVQYVAALLHAQVDMAGDGCAVWTGPEAVRARFPASRRDLRPEAVAAAVSYLELYEDYCVPKPAPGPVSQVPADPELDQVYSLARWNGALIAATQGGAVVWQDGRAVDAWREPLCTHVVATADTAWIGCRGALVRRDASGWKRVLEGRRDDTEGFAVYPGPGGTVRATDGDRSWELRGDTATPVTGRTGYDTLYRSNGELWTVDFLAAVEGPRGRLGLGSAAYPGSDPRSLYEDPAGRLWVIDFDAGFFTWDDRAGRFFPVPAGAAKASDVEVDGEGRAWLLGYTDGLTVREADGRTRALALPQGEYLRDLLLDGQGGAWVGSWHGVLRLHPDGSGWRVERWAVGE